LDLYVLTINDPFENDLDIFLFIYLSDHHFDRITLIQIIWTGHSVTGESAAE